MSKKRLIITSAISIVLVAILLMGSTYSIFTSSDVDEKANVYRTGNLDITYTLSENNIQITNNIPINEANRYELQPYRITVTNNGNVPYMFDLILEDTTASNVIDYQYIMTEVGQLDPKSLSECENNILKNDIIVPANDSVNVDIRVWISDKVQNSEIGKSFYGKLSIDGLAVYDDNTDIDNSIYEALAGYSVRCVTGDNTKYYYDLTTALNEGSTTNVETCTLLEDLVEGATIETALYDMTIDFNNKTLKGIINNNNSNSTIRLNNGNMSSTMSTSASMIQNIGTMYITDGTYILNGKHIINNTSGGKMYINGGIYTLTNSSDGTAIVNNVGTDSPPILNITNATITTDGAGIGNWEAGTVIIDNTSITTTNDDYAAVVNNKSAVTKLYNSGTTGSFSLANLSGTLNTYATNTEKQIHDKRSGVVFSVWQANSTKIEVAIFNATVTGCAVWTETNGQDDLVWYALESATNKNGYDYRVFYVPYSNHNSITSLYNVHCYNEDTFVVSDKWYWNFEH